MHARSALFDLYGDHLRARGSQALVSALLPPGWPGHEAARLFRAESARLWPAASRFVDCCLRADQPEAALPATGMD